MNCRTSIKIIWLRHLKCGHPKAQFFFFWIILLFLITYLHPKVMNVRKMPECCEMSSLKHVMCIVHIMSMQTRTRRKAVWGDGTLPPASEGTIPPAHASTLCRITWKHKPNNTKAQHPRARHGLADLTAQRSRRLCTEPSLHRMFSGIFLSCQCRELYFWSWSLLSTLLIMQSCSMTWNMSVNSVS